MNRVQFLGLTALALGANGPELPGMGVGAEPAKVKGPPSNGIRVDGGLVTHRYVTCSHCGEEPLRRFWKMDEASGALKRVFEQPASGGSIVPHTCPSTEPMLDIRSVARANPPAKKESDREASDFALSRAERRRQYNEYRKAVKRSVVA